MRLLLITLFVVFVFASTCCQHTNVGYDVDKSSRSWIASRSGPEGRKLTVWLAQRMIDPVMKVVAVECVDGIDPEKDSLSGGTLVLVSDSSESFGTPQHPYAYLFFTAGHVMEETASTMRPVDGPEGVTIYEQQEVKVKWQIKVNTYNYNGTIKEYRWLDLCEENPDTEFTTYRPEGHDIFLLLVKCTEPIGVKPALVASPEIADDAIIGDKIYIVGFPGIGWKQLRGGMLNNKISSSLYLGSAPADYGDSGGVVYDERARYVGTITSRPSRGSGVGYVPVSIMHDELLANGLIDLLLEVWK